jgi:hypothetical protein
LGWQRFAVLFLCVITSWGFARHCWIMAKGLMTVSFIVLAQLLLVLG